MIDPLYVSNRLPLRDQTGQVMVGSPDPGAEAGRWRVEIRVAPDSGVRYAPGKDGSAHPYNPLATPDSVGGVGLNAAEDHSGLFCMTYPERLPAGTKIFARAFNAPTPGEASFYADSQVATVPAQGSTLVLDFDPAQPLDGDDDDGDGLVNSWERHFGTDDRQTGDYDDDGMGDLQEVLAGTDPNDSFSNLSFQMVRRETGSAPAGAGADWSPPVRVSWRSVPGKRYQLQHTSTLSGEPEFTDVGEAVVARDGEYEIDMRVEVPWEAIAGTFRVKLVADGG